MPPGSIKDDNGVGFWIDLFTDFLKVQRHGPGVGLGNHPCGADTPGWADGAEDIGPGIALVTRLPRSTAALSPDTRQRSLLANARFILPPDFDGLVSLGLRYGRRDQVGEVFLCASWADASCPGC